MNKVKLASELVKLARALVSRDKDVYVQVMLGASGIQTRKMSIPEDIVKDTKKRDEFIRDEFRNDGYSRVEVVKVSEHKLTPFPQNDF